MVQQHFVQIEHLKVGPGQRVALCAEAGINYNGDREILRTLTHTAKLHGWDLVKIQTRINELGELTDVYSPEQLAKPRGVPPELIETAIKRGVFCGSEIDEVRGRVASGQTTEHDQKRALELLPHEIAEFVVYAREQGIVPLSTPWCIGAVGVLEDAGMQAYKIGSPSATDDALLAEVARTGKPIILSTGMMDLSMVDHAVEIVRRHNAESRLILMHCTSVYSAPAVTPGDHYRSLLNLRCIETFRDRYYPILIGWSGNDSGIKPAEYAAVLGAVMLEKHVTLWKGLYGSDQAISINPDEMMLLGRAIREIPGVMGDGVKRFYEEEFPVADKLRTVGPRRPNA